MRYLLSLILMGAIAGCAYGLSASATIGYPGLYCQPVRMDVQICRDDYRTWRCVNDRGYWNCYEVPWWIQQ